MEITTENAEETYQYGKKFAADLIKNKKYQNVILLVGELGAGKTTFVQGFARELGIENRILSPTFILTREYSIKNIKFSKLYHMDLYRLEGDIHKQAEDLGIEEIIRDKSNLMIIEWADKLVGYFPSDSIEIKFDTLGENNRRITIST